jgi:hypothetical protein
MRRLRIFLILQRFSSIQINQNLLLDFLLQISILDLRNIVNNNLSISLMRKNVISIVGIIVFMMTIGVAPSYAQTADHKEAGEALMALKGDYYRWKWDIKIPKDTLEAMLNKALLPITEKIANAEVLATEEAIDKKVEFSQIKRKNFSKESGNMINIARVAGFGEEPTFKEKKIGQAKQEGSRAIEAIRASLAEQIKTACLQTSN